MTDHDETTLQWRKLGPGPLETEAEARSTATAEAEAPAPATAQAPAGALVDDLALPDAATAGEDEFDPEAVTGLVPRLTDEAPATAALPAAPPAATPDETDRMPRVAEAALAAEAAIPVPIDDADEITAPYVGGGALVAPRTARGDGEGDDAGDDAAEGSTRRLARLPGVPDAPGSPAAATPDAGDAVPSDAEAAETLEDRAFLTIAIEPMLREGGRGRDAAGLLADRIAEAEGAGASRARLAALRVRLAEIQAEACDDRQGARDTLERVLAEAPRSLAALECLLRLARGNADPRAYVNARLRQADALPDGDAKAAALLDAGRRLRDRVRDPGEAERILARAVELSPGAAEAAAELADLRLANRLEAAMAAERAGDPTAARRHLRIALELRSVDPAANLALARLLADGDDPTEAEDFLRTALLRLSEAPAEVRGELLFRLAGVRERRGDAAEAHRLLAEAYRLRRDDLATRLALGESCFRARLWREAVLHLSALATHPDAPARAADVARGLAHAAQAEASLMRLGAAEALDEAALRLDPACTEALHALGQLRLDRGETAAAADLLEREAAATADARDRVRLFDALGDLALRALDDRARAERCFAEAVRAAAPLEARHVPLLEKLLELQRGGPIGAALGETAEHLSRVHPDPGTREARLDEAIAAYLTAGERTRARAAAARHADEHPLDEAAVWRASGLELADGELESAAARLGRALHAWSARDTGATANPRRAELWRRLGDARRARGDARGAALAYGSAISTAPASDGALWARRGLLALGEAGPAAGPAAVGHLRRLVAEEQRPAEVVALARALGPLAGAAVGAAAVDEARTYFQLALALGAKLADEDRAFLAAHPARPRASDEVYPFALDEADVRALVADPDDEPLGGLLEACWEAAPHLAPPPREALERAGHAGAERLPPVGRVAIAAMYPQVARALGGPSTLVYVARDPGAPDVSVLCASPPVVVFGPALAALPYQSHSDHGVAADAELRFRLGRAVELTRPRRILATGVPVEELARFLAALRRAFGRPGDDLPGAPEAEVDRLRKALPIRIRVRLEAELRDAPAGALDPARFLAACERAADRAGLVVCPDVNLAIRLAGGAGTARHLVRAAVHERALAIRWGR